MYLGRDPSVQLVLELWRVQLGPTIVGSPVQTLVPTVVGDVTVREPPPSVLGMLEHHRLELGDDTGDRRSGICKPAFARRTVAVCPVGSVTEKHLQIHRVTLRDGANGPVMDDYRGLPFIAVSIPKHLRTGITYEPARG